MRWLDTNTEPPRRAKSVRWLPQPADAVGVESVGRLVEQQDLRVAEQRAGEGQALPHAEGEPAGALVGGRLETDLDQHLVDPASWDAAHGGHGPEVVAGGVAGVHAAGVEDGADQAGRVPEVGVADAVVADLAVVGAGEPDHHPHRGRLAGSVRADEAGDAAGGHGEGQVVDRGALAVVLGDSVDGDHEVAPGAW